MRTIKQILEAFKKDLRIGYQAQKNVVDISERYIHELSEADLGSKGGVDYTTEEQDTGLKWFGKPKYQKSIILRQNGVDQFSKSVNTFVDSLPANIGYINIIQMYSLRSGNWVDCMNLKDQLSLCFDMTSRGVYFETNLSVSDLIITIEYTKITD